MTQTEKTEAQIDREKAAVSAMTNAKSNMDAVLSRVATLERSLATASGALARLKRHVGPDSQTTWHDGITDRRDLITRFVDERIAEISQVLA